MTAEAIMTATGGGGAGKGEGGGDDVTTLADLNMTAVMFISAASNDETLCAYKLFVNGRTVAVGPGRPEARVRDVMLCSCKT